MPFSPTTVFLEETSLVAKPAVPFDEVGSSHRLLSLSLPGGVGWWCGAGAAPKGDSGRLLQLKARLERRMEHMGVVVTRLHEDERCLIPMGGVLPRHPQPTLGIGGTAGMVHPSTGAPPALLPEPSP